MTEFKSYTAPLFLTREQCDWTLDTVIRKHAERIGKYEMARLLEDFDGANHPLGMSGCFWWDREAEEFLFSGNYVGRSPDTCYYFYVDGQFLEVVDLGGWMGPSRLSFQRYSRELEGRRVEFQARLVAIMKKSGLAYTINNGLWTSLSPEGRAAYQPQFVADDQRTPDAL